MALKYDDMNVPLHDLVMRATKPEEVTDVFCFATGFCIAELRRMHNDIISSTMEREPAITEAIDRLEAAFNAFNSEAGAPVDRFSDNFVVNKAEANIANVLSRSRRGKTTDIKIVRAEGKTKPAATLPFQEPDDLPVVVKKPAKKAPAKPAAKPAKKVTKAKTK
jgi:hypothetical protein